MYTLVSYLERTRYIIDKENEKTVGRYSAKTIRHVNAV